MIITEEKKNRYISRIHDEMRRRGFNDSEIPQVINKTGFMACMEEYPEEQMHYDPEDAVNEIIMTAALS